MLTAPGFGADSPLTSPDLDAARRFTRHLADLLGKERGDMVAFLLAVAECDGRRFWAELGYASLFEFLHRGSGPARKVFGEAWMDRFG